MSIGRRETGLSRTIDALIYAGPSRRIGSWRPGLSTRAIRKVFITFPVLQHSFLILRREQEEIKSIKMKPIVYREKG